MRPTALNTTTKVVPLSASPTSTPSEAIRLWLSVASAAAARPMA
ncbi:MAG: hypothetical protein BWZ07_02400 [Alphaproteobacteria bacterium ADurb.BinA280]|nr:MAG: hypothetical protein BWZ07_02400 [Alphaproteobacteria bacterium ADurb.BinA280]